MSNAKTLDPTTQTAPATAGTKETMEKAKENFKAGVTGQPTVRKGRSPVDPNEPKDKKFRRLATKRVTKALKAIGYVKNLSNSNQYEYTEEQANKILSALTEAVASVKIAFSGEKKAAESFTV
jgi:hypothetical protein